MIFGSSLDSSLMFSIFRSALLNAIFYYFQTMGNLQDSIQTNICLNEDAMSRIDKLKEVKRFEIKIASLDSMEIFSNKDVDEISQLRENTRAPFLHLTLSVEHQHKSLDVKYVIDSVKKYLPFTSSKSGLRTDVMKLRGSTDNERSFTMDLIEDKMMESVPVKYKQRGNRRLVEDHVRYEALFEAWKRRQDSIIRMYIHPSDSGRV